MQQSTETNFLSTKRTRRSDLMSRCFAFMTLSAFCVNAIGCGTGGAGISSTLSSEAVAGEGRAEIVKNETNQQTAERLINEVEQAGVLQRSVDGMLTIKPQTGRGVVLSSEAEQFAQKVLAETNKYVKSGQLEIRSDLTVHPIGETITRANETFAHFHWWGVQFACSNSNWEAFKNTWRIAGMNGAIGQAARFGLTGSWAATAVVPVIIAWMWTLDYVNRSGGYKGFFFNVTWSTFAWATPQS